MGHLTVIPMELAEANEFVANFHRHNKPVVNHKFSLGASDPDLGLVGVAIVGRPVARMLQDGFTLEVYRLCTRPDTPKNVCSLLYAACWRAWRAMGGIKLVTYTLVSESGSSLRAAGWKIVHQTKPRKQGQGWENRPNREWQRVIGQQKFRWEITT